MPVFTDQTGRKVVIENTPGRIISLVPSQTELLHYLNLEDEVVGITKFCIHPADWYKSKIKVGGTKAIKPEIIHQLGPDLIIANKEENVKEQIEELEKHYPVWISDVDNLNDAYEMIAQLGTITGKQEQANQLIFDIKKQFTRLLSTPASQLPTPNSPLTTTYLIWQKPFMTVGGDTFIHSVMEAAGFDNVFKENKRYPVITVDEIKKQQPALLLLSSEPFPFSEKHVTELKDHFPNTKIILVDGELFSWYGSRMLLAPEYFLNLRKHGLF